MEGHRAALPPVPMLRRGGGNPPNCRSHLAISSKYGDKTRLAKTIVDVEYTLANFEGRGQNHRGMYEYPF